MSPRLGTRSGSRVILVKEGMNSLSNGNHAEDHDERLKYHQPLEKHDLRFFDPRTGKPLEKKHSTRIIH